jgi:hypothetical protein
MRSPFSARSDAKAWSRGAEAGLDEERPEHAAALFHPSPEQLELRPSGAEPLQVALVAPGGEQPQVPGIALAGGPQ